MKHSFQSVNHPTNYREDFDNDVEASGQMSATKALIDLSSLEKYLSLSRVLIALSIILFFVAWNRGISLLYAMDALVISTLIFSWLIPKFNIRNIDVNLSLPEQSIQGEALQLSIETEKTGLLSRYMIELWGNFPFIDSNQNTLLLINKIGKKSQHEMSVVSEVRGLFTLDSFELRTSFPLGMFSTKKTIRLPSTQEILIYPKPLPVQQFLLASDPTQNALENNNSSIIGGSSEYVGIREYRHGDSPRHIHWPSSAKKGDLVVREFQQNDTRHLTIILDLNSEVAVGKGKHSTLEYQVTITASLINYAIDNHYSFDVFGNGEKIVEINHNAGAQSHQAYDSAMETLAWIQADGAVQYNQTVQQCLLQNHRGGTVVLFDHQNTVNSLIPELHAQHCHPLIYKFNSASFGAWTGSPEVTKPTSSISNTMATWYIDNGCDLESLFK